MLASMLARSTEGWVHQARQNMQCQSEEDKQTINILAAIFDNRITPDEAARTLAEMWEPQLRRREAPEFALFGLWFFLTSAITNLSGNLEGLDRLTLMLIRLSQQPDVIDERGIVARIGEDGPIYWRDMPNLHLSTYDHGYGKSITNLVH